jgi:hypothetical protein
MILNILVKVMVEITHQLDKYILLNFTDIKSFIFLHLLQMVF